MNKNIDLLKKIIKDTEEGTIDWIKAPKPDLGHLSAREHWKGEKYITGSKDKLLAMTLSYSVDDFNYSEMNVWFINKKENTRELIYVIEPGIFSFRTERNLKKLIKILNKKEIKGRIIYLNKTSSPEIIGPQLPNKDWEEVVY